MRSTRLALLLLVGLIPAVITCGGDKATGPAVPTALIRVSGDGQSGIVGQALANPLVVKVVDAAGTGVPGVSVAWSVTSGSGTLSPATTTTDAVGAATVTWTLGLASGANTVSAGVAGVATIGATVFSANALPGAVSTSQSSVSVSAATAVSGSTVTLTLQAKDANGNNLTAGGLTVVFSASGGTSTGTIGATTDNVNGTYTATFTAVTAGTPRTVSATINGTAVTSTLPTITVTVTCTPQLGSCLALDQFSLIPAGTFQMGSTAGYPDEQPVHSVTISRSFYMQKTEVTQRQWRAVMGSNPSFFPTCGEFCPVEWVSWDDITTFLQRLNAQTPGVTYRLPTEAEWEYAARAGTTGETYGTLDAIAWYNNNSSSQTHAVAGKQANAWGLYDMIGNVWEWVNDWYGSYSSGSVTDPTGPTGTGRVRRGGSWAGYSGLARAATRSYNSPSLWWGYDVGFRLVRTP